MKRQLAVLLLAFIATVGFSGAVAAWDGGCNFGGCDDFGGGPFFGNGFLGNGFLGNNFFPFSHRFFFNRFFSPFFNGCDDFDFDFDCF